MSVGYNSIRNKEIREYNDQFNKYLESIYSLDIKKLESFINGSRLNCEGSVIFDMVCNIFDPIAPKQFVNSELENLANFEFVTKCDLNKNQLHISFNNTDISVKRLDINIPNIKKGNLKTNISGYIYETIQIANGMGLNAKIVIGYLTENLDKIQKFHCWLEYNSNGKEYVIDYPHNIIMSKVGYYLLTQPKIINQVNSCDLNDEILNLLNSVFKLEYDETICFYDEFEKELKKIK